MYTILRINGIAICGIHGKEGATLTIPVVDCWLTYQKYFKKAVDAEEVEVCVLQRYAKWTVNGRLVDKPNSWFLTLVI